jgi:preprotein translocase subunit SecD
VEVPAAFADQVVAGQALPAGMDVDEILTGDQIASAHVTQDQAGQPSLALEFNSEGAAAFDDFAAANFDSSPDVKFAIVLDDTVVSALTLQGDHFGGQAQISGDFTAEQVNRLAAVIGFGALPLPIRELSYSNEDCVPTP